VPTLRDHPEQGGDQIIPTAFETPSSAPNAKDLAVNQTGTRGTRRSARQREGCAPGSRL
jgi:hypothetical protein